MANYRGNCRNFFTDSHRETEYFQVSTHKAKDIMMRSKPLVSCCSLLWFRINQAKEGNMRPFSYIPHLIFLHESVTPLQITVEQVISPACRRSRTILVHPTFLYPFTSKYIFDSEIYSTLKFDTFFLDYGRKTFLCTC